MSSSDRDWVETSYSCPRSRKRRQKTELCARSSWRSGRVRCTNFRRTTAIFTSAGKPSIRTNVARKRARRALSTIPPTSVRTRTRRATNQSMVSAVTATTPWFLSVRRRSTSSSRVSKSTRAKSKLARKPPNSVAFVSSWAKSPKTKARVVKRTRPRSRVEVWSGSKAKITVVVSRDFNNQQRKLERCSRRRRLARAS